MGAHLIDGEFQSDKYPTCPRGKVPLSVKDKTAQDLLWTYAQRRRSVDAEFSDDLEEALRLAGYVPKRPVPLAGPVRFRTMNVDQVFDAVRECFPTESLNIYVKRIDPAPHIDYRPLPMEPIADGKALLELIETDLRDYEQLRSVYIVRFVSNTGAERGRGFWELSSLPETKDLKIYPSGHEWLVVSKHGGEWQRASAKTLREAVEAMRTLQATL